MTPGEVRIIGLDGIPEMQAGGDVAAEIAASLDRGGMALEPGDVLVVTHKIVSKAEGQLIRLEGVEPSTLARTWAAQYGKDPRQVEITLRESRRIVRMDRGVIIAETHHGFICANAGVDASNVDSGIVCLLPKDPDGSAAAIRASLAARYELDEAGAPGVIITDSWGRPWRNGIVNFAIGVAGLSALIDYRGHHDAAGYELHVTVLAVADELAAASELVMHKLAARPVALIRGYQPAIDMGHGSGQDLLIDPARDMFR
ncbi:MAG: coenzyme F420-0:L-glutamate ligase [Thermomicrobiales bacterium]